MLTRLKVSGFKNLVDVDVRFGPFTCIAGVNGVGKSNLFDAIKFLSALANDSLLDAAASIRDEGGKTTNIRSLFHCAGDQYAQEMSFEVEMIIPHEGRDDLGQSATAKSTFLRYAVTIAYRIDERSPILGSLELLNETLEHIKRSKSKRKYFAFPHKEEWRESVLHGYKSSPFISTENGSDGQRKIMLNQDGSESQRVKPFIALTLPRTVLSTVNDADHPTALLARREMQSWRILQLEPSSLREPDKFFITAPGLGTNGSHLAAQLYSLAHSSQHGNENSIYEQVALRLSELIEDVRAIKVDRDDHRELLTLEVTGRDGTIYPARSLSDGTLRFLALAVLELDPNIQGLICLEEPENGIHPERIPAILRLLQQIAVDSNYPIGTDNPLRQVIVNTHSPVVVKEIPDDSLLIAESKEMIKNGQRFKRAGFSWLPETWRANVEPETHPVARGKLLAYLNPTPLQQLQEEHEIAKPQRRVIDRPDLQELFPFLSETT